MKGILEVLLQKGEVGLVELTSSLDASAESIRSALSALESLGLVAVERNDTVRVRLTSEARRLLEH